MRCVAVLLLLLTVLFGHGVAGADDNCLITGSPPSEPFGLKLCYMYSHNACCLPGFDQLIINAYSNIVPGGKNCGPGSQRVFAQLHGLREYLCLPCDPDEPKYRFESIKGDIVDGGIVPPSTNSKAGEHTWRICRSFLYGAAGTNEGLWGRSGSRYDMCGILLPSCMSTPVFNITTASFTYPSSSCSSRTELIVPNNEFGKAADPALALLSYVTQALPEFQIVVVDDSDPNYDYDATPCFGHNGAPGPRAAPLVMLAVFVATAFMAVL